MIAGVILAGGKSRRMDDKEKSFLLLGGRPLISRLMRRLTPQVQAIAISANGAPARFGRSGAPVIVDDAAAGEGPLAGILAGMRWAAKLDRMSHIVTVPVDTPFFPPDLVERLAERATGPRHIVVATSGGRRHNAVALWPVVLADDLARHLDRVEDRSVGRWIAENEAVMVDFTAGPDGLDPLFNINTPDDLEKARAALADLDDPS